MSGVRTVRVDLAGRGYDIAIGPGLIDRAGELSAKLLARPAGLSRNEKYLRRTTSKPHDSSSFSTSRPRKSTRGINLRSEFSWMPP